MDILQHVFEILLTKEAITDIVDTRIYAGNLPESPVFPFLEFNLLATEHVDNTDGTPSDAAYSVIQFDAVSKSHLDVIQLISAVRKNLQHQTTAAIQECIVDDGEQDLPFPANDGTGRKIFRRAIRLQFFHATEISA